MDEVMHRLADEGGAFEIGAEQVVAIKRRAARRGDVPEGLRLIESHRSFAGIEAMDKVFAELPTASVDRRLACAHWSQRSSVIFRGVRTTCC